MKHHFDIEKNGTLLRGAIYLPELAPGFDYHKKLIESNLQQYCAKLQSLLEQIKKNLHLTDNDIILDTQKPRLLLSVRNAKLHLTYLKSLGLLIARVEEMPTTDQLEIEVEFLK